MNDKKIMLIAKIAIYALAVVTLMFLIIVFLNSSKFSSPTPEALSSPMLENCFLMTYITFGIAAVAALIFPIMRMVKKPKQAVKGLLGIVGLFVLGLIAYLTASSDLDAQQLERLQVTESASIIAGAGLNLVYIVGACAILAAAFLAFRGRTSK